MHLSIFLVADKFASFFSSNLFALCALCFFFFFRCPFTAAVLRICVSLIISPFGKFSSVKMTTRKFPLANKVTFYCWGGDWCCLRGSSRDWLMPQRESGVTVWDGVDMYFKKPTDLQRHKYCAGPSHTEYYCIQAGATLESLLRFIVPNGCFYIYHTHFQCSSVSVQLFFCRKNHLQMNSHPQFFCQWIEIWAPTVSRLHKFL